MIPTSWKCPKCKYTRTGKNAHQEVMKHYYREHYKAKGGGKKSKGSEKKVYTFKPMKK